jgi:uncharacterized membrane protein YhfC
MEPGSLDIVARGLNALLMIALGLAVGARIARRWEQPWGLFGIGAATFVLSQVAHIPFNSLALSRVLVGLGWPNPAAGGLLVGALLLGLSAGVFEEGARFLMYRFWVKKARRWNEALMIGAGHGGVEAVLLGLLAGYALLQAMALRGVDLATVVPADQVAAARLQIEAYWAAPWYAAVLGAAERAFALCLHLSLSVMVLQTFARRQWFWLPLAIAWHTFVDAAAVAASSKVGPYWTEALIGVMACVSLAIVFSLRREAPQQEEVLLAPVVMVQPHTGDQRPTQDQLDDSRFSGGTTV